MWPAATETSSLGCSFLRREAQDRQCYFLLVPGAQMGSCCTAVEPRAFSFPAEDGNATPAIPILWAKSQMNQSRCLHWTNTLACVPVTRALVHVIEIHREADQYVLKCATAPTIPWFPQYSHFTNLPHKCIFCLRPLSRALLHGTDYLVHCCIQNT